MEKTYIASNGYLKLHDKGLEVEVSGKVTQLRFKDVNRTKLKMADSNSDGVFSLVAKGGNGYRLIFGEGDNGAWADVETAIAEAGSGKKKGVILISNKTARNRDWLPKFMRIIGIAIFAGAVTSAGFAVYYFPSVSVAQGISGWENIHTGEIYRTWPVGAEWSDFRAVHRNRLAFEPDGFIYGFGILLSGAFLSAVMWGMAEIIDRLKKD